VTARYQHTSNHRKGAGLSAIAQGNLRNAGCMMNALISKTAVS